MIKNVKSALFVVLLTLTALVFSGCNTDNVPDEREAPSAEPEAPAAADTPTIQSTPANCRIEWKTAEGFSDPLEDSRFNNLTTIEAAGFTTQNENYIAKCE